MSQTPDHHEEVHTGPIKTPRQMLLASVLGFLLPVLIIVGLVYFVVSAPKPSMSESSPEQVTERIAKIGSVKLGMDPALRPQLSGEAVYRAQCATCHAAGLAGAPKFGDGAAWSARLPQGLDALVTSAIKGKGSMAPQGGGDYTDYEIARAVVYMTKQAGGAFNEPAPPAAATASAAASASSSAAASPEPAPQASSATTTPPAAPAAGAATAAPQTEQGASVAVAAVGAATAKPAASEAAPAAPLGAEVGKAVYEQTCQVCHVAGVAGAPKLGDKAAWKPRASQGVEALLAQVIAGKGAMPPRGSSPASDAELRAAVQYMVDASK